MMKKKLNTLKIDVTLTGTSPLMFDRYAGDNNTQLAVMDKVYLKENNLVIPSINLLSFLSAQNSESATQRLIGRGYKEVCKACLSYITFDELDIPITRNGEKLTLENAGLTIHHAVARVKKGALSVPMPKERPLLNTPWEISFTMRLVETPKLNEVLLKKIFETGGVAIGIGTFRGVFGKFMITKWDSELETI